ncbi:MAG TPA: CdvA-like protein [Candidatus Nanoarchaeia archaeon]|nr:CdvA-like protein [Candidatus Nanoarchaeia archaeon]
MSLSSNLFLSIGKPVKDEYGRAVGRVASYATTPNGKFDAAYIEESDGRFMKQPIEYIQFNGADVTLLSRVKSNSAAICDQIPFIWRKDQALKDLNEKRKIAPNLYQELHASFATVLAQLRKDAQILQDEAIQGVTRCEEELTVLSYSVLHLELQHEIGKVSDEQYRIASTSLQEVIRRTTAEKADMESTKSKLSNVLLGDAPVVAEPKAIPTAPAPVKVESKIYAEKVNEPAANLPEPPVVVYVKEVGKAQI